MKTVKLSAEKLRRIVMEEVSKAAAASPELDNDVAVETDADELADAHEKHIDMLKALKIKEAKIRKALRQVQEARAATVKKLIGKI